VAVKALLTSGDFDHIVPRLPEDRRWELIMGSCTQWGSNRSARPSRGPGPTTCS